MMAAAQPVKPQRRVETYEIETPAGTVELPAALVDRAGGRVQYQGREIVIHWRGAPAV